jgi:FHA domain/B-box zinc finger
MPKLLVKGGLELSEIELKPGPNTLGSGGGNDIQIEDASVSEFHCEIVISDGKAVVRDLDSTNGTLIDREPIQEAVIRPGQTLQMGNAELVFETLIPLPRSLPAAPEMLMSTEPSPVNPQETPCKNHPASPATLICGRCHQVLCEECVNSRAVGKTSLKFCRSCGGSCVPLESKQGIRATMARSFPALLAGAFAYPLKRDGIVLIVGGALFLTITSFLSSFSFIIALFASGYLCAYLQKIVQSSALGDEHMPTWPDVSEFGQDVLLPALLYLGTFVLCLGPGFVCLRLAPIEYKVCGYLMVALGGFYLPMALLAVTMYDSLAAVNPMLIIPSIFRVPAAYAGVCVGLAAVMGVGRVVGAFEDLIRIPIVSSMGFGLLGLYFQVVGMRILGLFYYTQQERLRWF